ncbi:MAG: cytochrome c oxidase assembly protein [Geminicoccaceae bacterium]
MTMFVVVLADGAVRAHAPASETVVPWSPPVIGRPGPRPVPSHLLVVNLWLWHLPWPWPWPWPWSLAETNDDVHLIDHAMLLGAPILYWLAVLDCTRATSFRPAATVLGSLVPIVGTGFLGLILTLAPVALYGPGVTLSDQQAGGIPMWIPSGLEFAAALLRALDRRLARLGDGSSPLLTRVRQRVTRHSQFGLLRNGAARTRPISAWFSSSRRTGHDRGDLFGRSQTHAGSSSREQPLEVCVVVPG